MAVRGWDGGSLPFTGSVSGALMNHLTPLSQGSCGLDTIFIPILGPKRPGSLVPGHLGCGYKGEARTWPQTAWSELPTSGPRGP